VTDKQDKLPGEQELHDLLLTKLRGELCQVCLGWQGETTGLVAQLVDTAMGVLWPILEHEMHKVAELQQLLLMVAAQLGTAAAEARDDHVDAEVERLTTEARVEPRD
jgi:hypothetical protein